MTAAPLLLWILAAVLSQVVVGAAIAMWRRRHLTVVVPRPPLTAGERSDAAWAGWRAFRVARRTDEDPGRTQCSFELEPEDGKPLPPFKPGQYLTFALDVAPRGAPARPIVRCYSLSDRPVPIAIA